MKTQDLKEVSTEKLKKKVKIATILLAVCWAVIVVSASMAFFADKTILFAPIAGIIAVSIPMMAGLGKIKKEIARRNES